MAKVYMTIVVLNEPNVEGEYGYEPDQFRIVRRYGSEVHSRDEDVGAVYLHRCECEDYRDILRAS